jgi:hypothetical protein
MCHTKSCHPPKGHSVWLMMPSRHDTNVTPIMRTYVGCWVSYVIHTPKGSYKQYSSTTHLLQHTICKKFVTM